MKKIFVFLFVLFLSTSVKADLIDYADSFAHTDTDGFEIIYLDFAHTDTDCFSIENLLDYADSFAHSDTDFFIVNALITEKKKRIISNINTFEQNINRRWLR